VEAPNEGRGGVPAAPLLVPRLDLHDPGGAAGCDQIVKLNQDLAAQYESLAKAEEAAAGK